MTIERLRPRNQNIPTIRPNGTMVAGEWVPCPDVTRKWETTCAATGYHYFARDPFCAYDGYMAIVEDRNRRLALMRTQTEAAAAKHVPSAHEAQEDFDQKPHHGKLP